jgi:hypothetical protein
LLVRHLPVAGRSHIGFACAYRQPSLRSDEPVVSGLTTKADRG